MYKKIPVVMPFEEAITEKDYLAGASSQITSKLWHIKNIYPEYNSISYIPKNNKLFDEIIVNAIDHHFDSESWNEKVSNIQIFTHELQSSNSQEYIIQNDGMGFPLHDENIIINALTAQHCSSNHSKPNNMTGGINGLGLKIVVFNCSFFEIKTYDPSINKSCIISMINGNIEKKEFIENTKILDGTSIKFKLSSMIPLSIIKQRVFETALFINNISRKINITLNDKTFEGDMEDYLKYLSGGSRYHILKIYPHVLQSSCKTYELQSNCKENVAILGFVSSIQKKKYISILNGIAVDKCGFAENVMKYCRENIIKIASSKQTLDMKSAPSELKKNMFLVLLRRSYHSCFNLSSQTKDRVSVNCKKCKDLNFDCEDLYEIYKNILPTISKKQEKLNHYEKARFAGTDKSNKCVLFITEGESAGNIISKIINEETFPINREYCGILNITGVPKNIIRKTIITRTQNKQQVKFIDDKYPKGIHDIVVAMGLDYSKNHISSSGLNYGHMYIASDQDLDGIGNISGLILGAIGYLWPNLVNIICRANTPIISASIGKEIKIFFDEDEFSKWSQKNVAEIKYNKGLGQLDSYEVGYVSNNMERDKTIYSHDINDTIITDYFTSEDSDYRKKSLMANPIKVNNFREMSIRDHIHYWGIMFGKYKNARQIPNYIDGLNISTRKILFITRDMPEKKIKVAILAGRVIEKANYDHGDSLSSTIMSLAQAYMGARVIPLLRPCSVGVGSINSKRKETSPARYVYVGSCPIIKLIYPKEDDIFLKERIEDGRSFEPINYVPIIPICITEFANTPGIGWKCSSFPRNLEAVITKIKNRLLGLKYDPDLDNFPFIYDKLSYLNQGTLSIMGSYEILDDKIKINQLPPQMWVNKYIKLLKLKDFYDKYFIGDPINRTSKDDKIHIDLFYKKSYREELYELHEKNKLARMLLLIKHYDKQLNFIEEGEEYHVLQSSCKTYGRIHEFKSYNEIFDSWFEVRANLYQKRYNHTLDLLSKKLLSLENKFKFILEEYGKEDYKIDDNERYLLYESRGFSRFNESYDYLDNIKIRDTCGKGLKNIKEKISLLQKKIDDYKKLTWKILWRNELNSFIKLFNKEFKCQWK